MQPLMIIKKYKLSYFLLPFVIIFLLIGSFYIYYSIPYWDNDIIWKDINIDGIKLSNGNEYNLNGGYLYFNNQSRKLRFEINPLKLVENEAILRFALFYQITQEDPLYTAPGLEPESYKYSVDKLESIQAEMLRNLKLDMSVVPINYLKESAVTAKVNENFVNNPSKETADELLDSYEKTNQKYLFDVNNLLKKVEDSPSEDKILVQAGSKTTTKIIAEDLKLAGENSAVIENLITKRRNCLDGSILFCSRKADLFEEETIADSTVEESPVFLSKENLYFTKDPQDSITKGPYQVQTTCWNEDNGEPKYSYLYLTEENTEFKRLFPKLATTNYYMELPKDVSDLISIEYHDRGLNHRVVYETTPYNCNDLSYQAKVATMNLFLEKYSIGLFESIKEDVDYLVSPDELKDIVESGVEYEKKVYDASNPTEKSFQDIEKAYKNYYSFLVNSNSSSSHKDEALERYLFLERKLADFDATVNFLSYILEGFSKISMQQGSQVDDYVYLNRSGYSLLLMPFSKSAWRETSELQFIQKDVPQLNEKLLDFESLLKNYGANYASTVTHLYRNKIWYDITGETIR